jgi:hypothetical protein
MKFTRSLIFLAALCGPFFWPAGAAAARQKAPPRPYKIYCVGGVVLVENRTAQEIEREKKARPCLLTRTEFTNLYTARRAAKRFGGAGSPCRCPDAPTAN